MQKLQSKQLSDLKFLTDKMLTLANESSWDELELMEKQRVSLIEQFFANKFTEKDTPIIQPVIESIISINDRITEILVKNKKKLQVDFSQFNSSKQAENAYLKNIG